MRVNVTSVTIHRISLGDEMASPNLDAAAILQASPVFRHLDASARRDLAALARLERCPQRTLLVQRTEAPASMRYIVSGAVELSLSASDGRTAKLPPLAEGDWATWLGCFQDSPLAHDLWSAPDSVFLAFPTLAVRTAVSASAPALVEAISMIGQRLRALVAWTLASNLVSDEQRLAHLLLHVSENQQAGDASVTHEQLAQLGLGSRQRVGRMLKQLEARGLVECRYGGVAISSCERLLAFSQPG